MQKVVGDKLYVFDLTPFVITENKDKDPIFVQEEKVEGYKELNPDIANKIEGFNQFVICVNKPEWAQEQPVPPTPTAYSFLLGGDAYDHIVVYINGERVATRAAYTDIEVGTPIAIHPTEEYSLYTAEAHSITMEWNESDAVWQGTMPANDAAFDLTYTPAPAVEHNVSLTYEWGDSIIGTEFESQSPYDHMADVMVDGAWVGKSANFNVYTGQTVKFSKNNPPFTLELGVQTFEDNGWVCFTMPNEDVSTTATLGFDSDYHKITVSYGDIDSYTAHVKPMNFEVPSEWNDPKNYGPEISYAKENENITCYLVNYGESGPGWNISTLTAEIGGSALQATTSHTFPCWKFTMPNDNVQIDLSLNGVVQLHVNAVDVGPGRDQAQISLYDQTQNNFAGALGQFKGAYQDIVIFALTPGDDYWYGLSNNTYTSTDVSIDNTTDPAKAAFTAPSQAGCITIQQAAIPTVILTAPHDQAIFDDTLNNWVSMEMDEEDPTIDKGSLLCGHTYCPDAREGTQAHDMTVVLNPNYLTGAQGTIGPAFYIPNDGTQENVEMTLQTPL